MRALNTKAQAPLTADQLEQVLTNSYTVPTGVHTAVITNVYFTESSYSDEVGGQPGVVHLDAKVDGKNVSDDFTYERYDKDKGEYVKTAANGQPTNGYKMVSALCMLGYGMTVEEAMHQASTNMKTHKSYGKELSRPTVKTPKDKKIKLGITETRKNKNKTSNEIVERNKIVAMFDLAGASLAEQMRGDSSNAYMAKFHEKFPTGEQIDEVRTGTGGTAYSATPKATGTGSAVPTPAAPPAMAFDDFADDEMPELPDAKGELVD